MGEAGQGSEDAEVGWKQRERLAAYVVDGRKEKLEDGARSWNLQIEGGRQPNVTVHYW